MSVLIAVGWIVGWLAGAILSTRVVTRRLFEWELREFPHSEPDGMLTVLACIVCLLAWPVVLPFAWGWHRLMRLLNPRLAERADALTAVRELREKAAQMRRDAATLGGEVAAGLRALADEYDQMAREKERIQ